MTQGDAGSAPMLGSQRGTPIAWAVMVRWEYRDICDTYEQAKERADAITYWDDDDLVTASVQPLYHLMQPAITKREREAIKAAADFCESTCEPLPSSDQLLTIRDLLSRLS
jgi:hypothetical protein